MADELIGIRYTTVLASWNVGAVGIAKSSVKFVGLKAICTNDSISCSINITGQTIRLIGTTKLTLIINMNISHKTQSTFRNRGTTDITIGINNRTLLTYSRIKFSESKSSETSLTIRSITLITI